MKKVIGIIVALAAVFGLVYFGFTFYISQMTSELVNSAWEHKNVLPEKYEGVLTLYDYKRLDWLNKIGSSSIKAARPDLSYPSTVWRFNSATTTFYYTVTNSSTGTPLPGCDNVKCTIEWENKDGKWVVNELTEGK